MAVQPEHQSLGIGAELVRRGIEMCRGFGHVRMVVPGHPGYYRRFGFLPARRFGIHSEFEAPGDAFMILELEAGALGGVSGRVSYQPEFAAAARSDG